MKKRQIGNSDLYVSERSLGCMSLGTDEAKATRVVDYAIDQGINYLDTADLYDFGQNEEIVGKAIKGKRDKIIIGTKVGNHYSADSGDWYWDPSKNYIKNQVKSSLNRLQTDYIDLYQLHGGTIEDPIDETIEAFEELKKEGLIRYYGISSIRPNVIKEYIQRSSIVSVMTQYSLLDRRPEEETLDLLHENNISVLVRGTLAKGMLSDNGKEIINKKAMNGYLGYQKEELEKIHSILSETAEETGAHPTETAIQYVLKHPAVATAVLGASTTDQINNNLAQAEEFILSDDYYKKLQVSNKPNFYDKHR